MKIAVVTGASSGYGKEFAKQLAARGGIDEVWVVARRKERLEALAAELAVPVRAVPLDLEAPESYAAFAALLEKEHPQVVVLVNASGFGYFHPFAEEPLELSLRMVDLNDKALVALCRLSLPYMERGAQIFNIASSSAFQPVPYIGVYAATKAFVLSFTRSLNVELKPRGIRAMAVCPHWTKTEFFDTAVKDDTICYYNFYNITSEVVAEAFRNMARGRDVSLCGWRLKLQVFLAKLLPHRTVMKVWCSQQKKPF